MNPKTKTWTLEIREDLAEEFEEFLSEHSFDKNLSRWIEMLIWHFLADENPPEHKLAFVGDFLGAMKEKDAGGAQ